MFEFLIILGAFGLLSIPLIIMFLVCGADWKNKITGTLVVTFFWLLLSVGVWVDVKGDANRWNDGYCDCGKHWELSAVSESRHGFKTKYYSCPNCHKEIEI